jgi:hypothetical protein
MALPLTVKTETVLVNRSPCHQNMNTDQETGDHMKEAVRHTQQLEDPRDLATKSTPTDLEETREDSRSITKTPNQTTNAAPEYPTKT